MEGILQLYVRLKLIGEMTSFRLILNMTRTFNHLSIQLNHTCGRFAHVWLIVQTWKMY